MAYVRGKSGSFTFGDSYLTVKVNWSDSYSVDENNSIVSIDGIEVKTTAMLGTWYPSLIIKVNGEDVVAMQYYTPASHKVSIPAANTYYTVVPEAVGATTAPWVSSVIPHDEEGRKTIEISVVANPAGHNLTSIQLYRANGTIRSFRSPQTQTVALTDIPRLAVLTVGSGTLGEPQQLSVDRYFEEYLHTITCTVGSVTETICEKDAGTSYMWTPPLEFANQIPNVTRATATYKVSTFNGNKLIGTHVVYADLEVPESVIPTVSATWIDGSGAFDLMGTFVKLISRLSVDVVGTGIYGSSIVGASVTLNGKPYSGGAVMDSGQLQLVATVTDSRGRSASAYYDIYVADYQTPTARVTASRCLEDGTADDLGEFALVTVSGFVSPVDGANAATLSLRYGGNSKTETLVTGQISYSTIVPAPSVSTMEISAVISDKLLASPTSQMVLSIGYATVDYFAGGKGIAFGTTAKKEGFTCAMDADFSGHSVTGLADPVNAKDAATKDYVDKVAGQNTPGGAVGGYYTPTVTQVGADTVKFSFSASADGMAAVEDTSLTLPAGPQGPKGGTGERGTGILKVTTAPSSYTTAIGSYTPKYRIALSTVTSQSKVSKVMVGDIIQYSYYQYAVDYLDSTYAYISATRTSLRGSTGAAGTSPTATVEQTDSGATIAITDVNGTTTATVTHGKDAPQESVLYIAQGLNEAQQSQARKNIGAASATDGSTVVVLTNKRIVTQADIHWMEGWQSPNKTSASSDLASADVNLQNSHSRRMSMLPLWIVEGTVLTRNDAFYTAIDDSSNDSDGYPVRIMVSLYDPESDSANPMGWVNLLYDTIANNETITISKSGWYVFSITHGTANSTTKSFGHPYSFMYELPQGYEPNYVMCVDWKTFYNVRGSGVSQPAFANGLNWACRREPGCPYYLDNQGYGSEYNRGGYKTTNLTLASKTGSSVAGIMSYKDEIWTFFTSDDDHSTLGSVTKYRIYENHWIEYLGRCWINAGHINSVHYDPISDTMVWGNGSTSYTMEGEGYILNRFSESVLANAYNDEICLMDDMGVDTISLPIATYGVKANVIGIGCDYYEGNTMSLIVALLTNDGNTLRLGHIPGTEEAKPQYLWKNCTWLDAMTIGDANETIGAGSTQSYAHCVQDMTVWQGQLLWGEGHGENRYALWRYTPTESVRVSNLMQTMPKSNVHAVTEHNGKLFGSGLNMFCMIDPKAGIEFVYGMMPYSGIGDIPDSGGDSGGNSGGDATVNYAVSYNLTKCTSDNSTTIVAEGNSFSAMLTPTSGYELTGIMVTMGGTDITAAAVSGATINIASVTGNIVITAVATEVAKANLWDLTERTEYTKAELGLSTSINSIAGTAARTIRYDKYLRGATYTGNWNFNASQQPTLVIDGENAFTITLLQGGNGLGVPMDLEVGKTYKITYTADKAHRAYATYFDESGVYANREGLGGYTSDVAAGTYTRTLTVSDYAYCQLTFTATVNVTTSFTNIVIEEA